MQYITIDNAIQGILSLGQGCYLAKTDIESAFRLIPLRPSDYELFGMYWEGSYYYDKVLPFGLRSAPFLFNKLSEAVEWILLNKCCISFVCHILDDFLIIEPASDGPTPSQGCKLSLSSMLLTFRNLGIPIAVDKTQGPCTSLEFMGIILDSARMEVRLPPDKVERIQTSLSLFESRKSCTLKELQALIGTLNFACRVVPPGRPFLQRMIELTGRVSQPHHHIKLSSGFFNSKRSRIPRVMDLVRHLTLLTLRYNFYLKVSHIEGKRNEIADSISRFQMERFRLLAPHADPTPCPVPQVLWEI